MSPLLDELHDDHRVIAGMLAALDHEVRQFECGVRPDYDAIEQVAHHFVDQPDRWHHPTEELVLERLRQRDPAAAARVGDLSGAHTELSQQAQVFLDGLRAVMGHGEMRREALVRKADEFIRHQRQHLASEESTFFPAAERALSDAHWLELEAMAKTVTRGEAPVGRLWRCVATTGEG